MTFLIYTEYFKTIQTRYFSEWLLSIFFRWQPPLPTIFDGLPYPPEGGNPISFHQNDLKGCACTLDYLDSKGHFLLVSGVTTSPLGGWGLKVLCCRIFQNFTNENSHMYYDRDEVFWVRIIDSDLYMKSLFPKLLTSTPDMLVICIIDFLLQLK